MRAKEGRDTYENEKNMYVWDCIVYLYGFKTGSA